ncbi:MAG TPA: MFS transporter [Jiangellales bacterium]|nr:MFS transporter [Jiangellales bacterium]
MTAFAVLRFPAFRRYVIGQLLSVTCSWVQVVALSWVVVNRDPAAVGWVVGLQFAPSLLLGPWFGTVVDRHDRKRILILCEAGLGLIAVGYGIAISSEAGLRWIFILAALWGVINALDTPARQAMVPALVPPDRAARASAVTGIVMLLGMAGGSALGTALVAGAGPTIAFTVNAASFLFDIVLLSTIRLTASAPVRRAPRQLRLGVEYILRTPRVRNPLIGLAILGTFAFTIQVSVPILAKEAFAGGSSLVGAALTAVTVGGLAGAVIAAIRGAPGPRALTRAAAAMAASMIATAIAPTIPIVLAGLAGVGLAWSLFVVSTIAILQTAEAALLGRIMSWLAVVLVGGTAVGGPLAGLVAALVGARAPFLLGAAAALAAGVVAAPRAAEWSRASGRQRWHNRPRGADIGAR